MLIPFYKLENCDVAEVFAPPGLIALNALGVISGNTGNSLGLNGITYSILASGRHQSPVQFYVQAAFPPVVGMYKQIDFGAMEVSRPSLQHLQFFFGIPSPFYPALN
jgi:hypothetical protein